MSQEPLPPPGPDEPSSFNDDCSKMPVSAKRKSEFDLGAKSPGKKPCCEIVLRATPGAAIKTPNPLDSPHFFGFDQPTPPAVREWWSAFQQLRTADKMVALSGLPGFCDASQIQHLKNTINPYMTRDFIVLLPHELSMYILSRLSKSDLLRTAQVSSIWRTLSEDMVLWQEKCEEADISMNQLPDAPRVPPGRTDPTPVKRRCPYKSLYMRWSRIEANWRKHAPPKPTVLRGHEDHVITCLKLCDDVIISGSDDNTLRVWSATTGQCVQVLAGHTGGVWTCQVSPDARTVVSGSTDRTVRVWDLQTGNCRHTMAGHTSTVRCIGLRDNLAVTGSRDATVRVWNIETGQCKCVFQGHLYAVRCVRFDGRLAISGSYDFTVRVWDVIAEKCIYNLEGHTQRVYSIQYDALRGIVVSGSLDTTLRVWSLDTGECKHELKGHKSLNSALDLRDNILISGNADSMVKIWDISTGQCLHTLSGPEQHKSAVTGLQLLKSGLAVTCSDDGTVKIWDTKTGLHVRDIISLDSGGNGGVIWRLKASQTRLVCAVGSRNGVEDTKLLLMDFNCGYA